VNFGDFEDFGIQTAFWTGVWMKERKGRMRTFEEKVHFIFIFIYQLFSSSLHFENGYELYENGGMNAVRMVKFIYKFIKNKFINNLIIMDNGGSHKSKEIKKEVEKTGNQLLYTLSISIVGKHWSPIILSPLVLEPFEFG
jgi:hypothetical protein|tara:strand:- start:311 stop:730 length:420 start_codon:yes stop_codon:yes gene_type:complete